MLARELELELGIGVGVGVGTGDSGLKGQHIPAQGNALGGKAFDHLALGRWHWGQAELRVFSLES